MNICIDINEWVMVVVCVVIVAVAFIREVKS